MAPGAEGEFLEAEVEHELNQTYVSSESHVFKMYDSCDSYNVVTTSSIPITEWQVQPSKVTVTPTAYFPGGLHMHIFIQFIEQINP